MDNNDNKKDNNENNQKKKGIVTTLIIAICVLLVFIFLNNRMKDATNKEISYNEFISMLEKGQVESVNLTDSKIEIVPKENDGELVGITYYTGRIAQDEEIVNRLQDAGVTYKREISSSGDSILYFFASYILPLLIFWVGLYLVYKFMFKGSSGGGLMGVGKSNAKLYVQKETGITFKDVAGEEEAKDSLTEMVDFLHSPEKYAAIGAKLPKGALLVGPPGTGKTLLAKAVAGEAEVPFFSLTGSDFVEMFVGVGASRVRDLFKQAQSMAPCIIFIDEIDAIGKKRDASYGGGNDEREQTLNQLLSEMDGFDTSKGLVVIGATNRPEVLDKALLRPGRFDRRVIVERPDLKGRVAILKVHAKDVLMDDSVDFDEIALATSGAVGADLANMINEAAIMAVKAGRKAVNQADLFEAVEVVIAGKEKKDRILGKEEKKIVAYHECGHALVTALLKNTEPVQKITIVPRTMGSLGYVMQVPEEEKYLMTKAEMLDRITTLYGGRAAEEIIFDSVTTGASNDIEQATRIARAMVTQYGMTERFGLIGLESIESRYLDGRAVMNCGEQTASEIDEEVMKILKECHDKAYNLIKDNQDALAKLADYLFENETITGKEFMKIFRKVKGIGEPEGDLYDAIVLDVDGTLVGSDKTISEATKEALISAQERGKKVVIASGRSISGVRHTASAIQLQKYGGYIIAYNGTTVINCQNGECIYNQIIPEEHFKLIYQMALEFNVGISVYKDATKEIVIGNGLNPYIEMDAKACDISIVNPQNFIKELNFPVNKFLLSGDPAVMEKVEKIFAERIGDKCNVFRSDPCFVEVLPRYIDKAMAVDKLIKYIDIDKKKLICVGDSFNDISMIRYAGLGVAMGNAQQEVKDIADYITHTNDEDGVVDVVNRFMTPKDEEVENN